MNDGEFGEIALQRTADGTVKVVAEIGDVDRLLVTGSLLKEPNVHEWFHRHDGTIQFDTAGEYVYRVVGRAEHRPGCFVVERVNPTPVTA